MVSKGFPNVITSGQQHNIGEKPSVILYTCLKKNQSTPRPSELVVSHIQRIGCQPEKTTLQGGQSRSWSVEQGKKKEKKKSGSAPPPPYRYSFVENKNKKSRDASTCLGATQVGVTQVVSVRLASVQGFLRLVG